MHKLSMETLVSVKVVAWEANGSHGQYIVVVPKARLVAVRQVGEHPEIKEDQPWPYSYEDFTQRIIAVAQALTPALEVDPD